MSSLKIQASEAVLLPAREYIAPPAKSEEEIVVRYRLIVFLCRNYTCESVACCSIPKKNAKDYIIILNTQIF